MKKIRAVMQNQLEGSEKKMLNDIENIVKWYKKRFQGVKGTNNDGVDLYHFPTRIQLFN